MRSSRILELCFWMPVYSSISAPSKIDQVSCPITNLAFVAIKTGRPQEREERSISESIRERSGNGRTAVGPFSSQPPGPDESHVSYGRGHQNQSLCDRAARDTIGVRALPQSAGESVSAFCLPPASGKPSARQAVFDLVGGNASLKRREQRPRFHPSRI